MSAPWWHPDRPLTAVWLGLDDVFAAEALLLQGFDVGCIDLQHGEGHSGSLPRLLPAVQQAGARALVRAPSNDPATLGRILDLGADGVIVPLVDTPEDAAAAVAACRYPPEGRRSYGPLRAALRDPDHALRAHDTVAVLAMIETADGLANLDAICDVPGLSGIFIGPADLGLALGLVPRSDDPAPEHREAVARILGTCRARGLLSGLYSDDPEYAAEAAAQGAELIVLATDHRLLVTGARARLAAWRERL